MKKQSKPNSTPTPCHQPLGDGLVLRTPADKHDIERIATFNGAVHGPEVVAMTRNLFVHHPNTQHADMVFVEDERNGQIVSSLCLIPWTWRYEDVEIPAGEMGIVGTLEAYRRKGLIRAQVGYFKRRLRERGCLLSQIQGIPYYYRQFGYAYALPLEGGLRLELRHVPAPPDTPFTFRLATIEDVPTLMRLYADAARDLTIHTARDTAIWQYLLTYTGGTAMESEIWLIQRIDGQTAGYMTLPRYHFDEELAVSEVSRLGFEAAIAALNHARKLAFERDKPGLRLNLPTNCTLMRLARALGAYDLGTYAWQIHVPDVVALLRALTPVFERRIAQSPFAGLSRHVRIGLYRETLALRFEAGRLTEVTHLGLTEWEDIRFPPLQFIPLVFGHRTWEELHATHPDVGVAPTSRLLVDTLFPKVSAFFYTIY